MQDANFIRFPFYSKLSEEDKELLKETTLKKDLDKGQIIMGDNSRCNGVPLVVRGSLRLFRISEKGREMTLYRMSEGEICILGAICAMSEIKYDFSLEAEKDSTVINIPPDIFKELFFKSKIFQTYIFNALAEKLIMSMETIEMLIFISIEQRILEYLHENANKDGEVKTTHEKMAIELGSSREVITRQLRKMAEKDLLTLKRGKIILNNVT